MAPNKKYLSLEEAAIQLRIKTEELIRLREKGEIRGFADRGTWKFKADDIAEFRRRSQPDSDPDLPMIDDADENDEIGNQPTVVRRALGIDSDSDVRLVSAEDPSKKRLSGSSADIASIDLQKSDSDIRLVEPARAPKKGSDSDVTIVKPKPLGKADSDSDVRMIDAGLPDSDSDVKLVDSGVSLVDSDSDVRLARSDSDVRMAQSDSDVRLAPLMESDSDVKLIGGKSLESDSDSDVMLLPRSSRGGKSSGRKPLDSDSGKIDFDLGDTDNSASVLSDANDSAVTLSGDSGIRLAGDSGVALAGDSGIRLSEDSGVQLMQPADSGISLEGLDSGIRFADSGVKFGDDSGIKLASASSGSNLGKKPKKSGSSKNLKGKARDDIEATSPLLFSEGDEDDLDSTAPLLSPIDSGEVSASDLSEFDASDTSEMQMLGDSGQSVVIFEDDEEDAPPVGRKKNKKTVEDSIFEVDDADEEPLEELEVSDEDLSGNDFDDLAFDDGDDAGDESFSEGSSQFEITSLRKAPVKQEVEWSTGFCGLLFASLCVLIVGSLVSADLLRVVWAQTESSEIDPGISWLLAGFWG
ncbi:DNA-binding protein [Schlesneria paludicola]|uniref:DNA-binding protein n=1 Tax=Schlesneria paludicola TaxID=360056 RepID=UPI00029A9BB2|nr:DNA-binding protein [Schlesneria paludicola]